MTCNCAWRGTWALLEILLAVVGAFSHKTDHIAKPPGDNNSHRLGTLKNGLKVLLIHNPEFTDSQFCLTVNAGSYDDPVNVRGTANLIHQIMATTSSCKPARPDSVSETLLFMHDGGYKFYTFDNYTAYRVYASSENIGYAIDAFAETIAAPILSEGRIYLGAHKVDLLYNCRRNNHIYMHKRMLNATSNSSDTSLVAGFESIKTLDQPVLVEAVEKFWEAHYVAKKMCLILYSDLPLSEMERLVDKFECIRSGQEIKMGFRNAEECECTELKKTKFLDSLLKQDYIGQSPHAYQYVYRTKGEWYENALNVSFFLPPIQGIAQSVPLELIIDLIGCGMKLLLVPYLNSMGLASDFKTSTTTTPDSVHITISIHLTRWGVFLYRKVLESLCLILNNITITPEHVEWWVNTRLQKFGGMGNSSIMKFLPEICKNMHADPPGDILRKGYAYNIDTVDIGLCGKIVSHIADHTKWVIILIDKEYVKKENDAYDDVRQIRYQKEERCAPYSSMLKMLEVMCSNKKKLPTPQRLEDVAKTSISWLAQKVHYPFFDPARAYRQYFMNIVVEESSVCITSLILHMAKYKVEDMHYAESVDIESMLQISIDYYKQDSVHKLCITFRTHNMQDTLVEGVKQFINSVNHPPMKYYELAMAQVLYCLKPVDVVEQINARDAYFNQNHLTVPVQIDYMLNMSEEWVSWLTLFEDVDVSLLEITNSVNRMEYRCKPIELPDLVTKCNLPVPAGDKLHTFICKPISDSAGHTNILYPIENSYEALHTCCNKPRPIPQIEGAKACLYNAFVAELLNRLLTIPFLDQLYREDMAACTSNIKTINNLACTASSISFSMLSKEDLDPQEAFIKRFVSNAKSVIFGIKHTTFIRISKNLIENFYFEEYVCRFSSVKNRVELNAAIVEQKAELLDVINQSTIAFSCCRVLGRPKVFQIPQQ